MSTSMNLRVDDHHHFLPLSQLYPEFYTHMPPQQGEGKVKRRRKKKKGEKAEGKKRKLNEEQVKLLEMYFGNEHKLESDRKDKLALELGLDPRQVAVWFQNRRARWKIKKLEEEYSKLKIAHQDIVLEKFRLESEVLKLKEQLWEANKKIERILIEGIDGILNNNPTSMEGIDEACFGEQLGTEGHGDVHYMQENNHIHGMEWVDLYM